MEQMWGAVAVVGQIVAMVVVLALLTSLGLLAGLLWRHQRELTHHNTRLMALTQHLQTVQEDERQRLARDLHDELGALLTAAKLDAARIRSRLGSSPPEALERLAQLVDTLDAVIALQRRITEGLWPASLGHLGLAATLEILAREFAQRAGIVLHSNLAVVDLSPGAQLVAYRLVQEALTNLGKHAQARQVWVSLLVRHGQAVVTVRDDGVGFDTQARPRSGCGLMGMRIRAEAEGGTLDVTSAPGQGTQISLTLPLPLPSP